jgi:hypothetical protein
MEYPNIVDKMNTTNTPDFAKICWGDYILDGRIVPFKKFEADLPIIEELNEIIDYYIDEMFRDY